MFANKASVILLCLSCFVWVLGTFLIKIKEKTYVQRYNFSFPQETQTVFNGKKPKKIALLSFTAL